MCTHLHVDHVGWNTQLENGRWVPTFPRAKYLFADRELDHWTRRQKADPESCPWITDSVLPIVEAKRDERVKSDHVVDDLVKLIPTPGHTVDHYSVQVGKRGVDAIITGDMVHSPLQIVILRLVCLQTTTQSKLARPGADCSSTFARSPPYCARRTLPRPQWAGSSAAEERLTLSRFQVDRLGDRGSARSVGVNASSCPVCQRGLSCPISAL